MNAIIIATISLGFYWYFKRAIQRTLENSSDLIDKFFLAGRNIGRVLFANTTWSNSLGFGNSMFVAIWGGYSWGLGAIWIQALWALGMVLYGRFIPYILEHTGRFTLHGFLGSAFGIGTKNLTAFVSLTGLLVCIGFEVTFAGEFFATVMGNSNNAPIVILLFATLLATFCSIGGYQGNVALDVYSNIFASLSMLVFLACMVFQRPEGFETIVQSGVAKAGESFFHPSMPMYELIGFGVFTLFQIIDMTNWQSVSANQLPEDDENKKKHIVNMRRAINFSALSFMIFPTIVGSLIGYYFRQIAGGDVSQSEILIKTVTASIPQDVVIKTILLSGILFGFLSSSLACTNSWLLASVQTLSWDLFDYKKMKSVNFNVDQLPLDEHVSITRRAKIMLYVVGAGGTILIYSIYKVWDAIFSLQFMMFGAGLSMLPAFVFLTIIKRTSNFQGKRVGGVGFYSVLIGFITAITMFIYSIVYKNSDVAGMIPPAVLVASTIVFLAGMAFNKR
jgi:MFS family permease